MTDQPESENTTPSVANSPSSADQQAAEKGSLVNVSLTDFAGLGALARSPAGKVIAEGLVGFVSWASEPVKVLLVGKATTAVEAGRIVAIAKAEAEARKYSIDSVSFSERMQERVILEAVRDQLNIDATAKASIEMADAEFEGESANKVEEDFFRSWQKGASAASNEQLQDLWARILVNKTVAPEGGIRLSTLDLVQKLDSELAESFQDVARYFMTFGCIPMGIAGLPFNFKDFNILSEIGFFQHVAERAFVFNEFSLQYNMGMGSGLHDVMQPSQRCIDLLSALTFGPGIEKLFEGHQPQDDEVVEQYFKFFQGAYRQHFCDGIKLIIESDKKGYAGVSLTFPRKTQTNEKNVEEVIDLIGIYGVECTELVQSLIRRIMQNNSNVSVNPIQSNW